MFESNDELGPKGLSILIDLNLCLSSYAFAKVCEDDREIDDFFIEFEKRLVKQKLLEGSGATLVKKMHTTIVEIAKELRERPDKPKGESGCDEIVPSMDSSPLTTNDRR